MLLRVVDLFCGGGGAASGLEKLGLIHSLLVDNKEEAVRTCWDNLDKPVRAIQMDLSKEECQHRVIRGVHPEDLVWASPPCPLHSKAKTRWTQPAVDGWPWVMEILRYSMPAGFIIENVPQAPFLQWEKDTQALGYHTRTWTLDAAFLGIPQHRMRTFLLGWKKPPRRDALEIPRHPSVSMLEALPWLLNRECPYSGVNLKWYSREETLLKAGSKPDLLDKPSPTVTCQEVKGTRASSASLWRFNGGPDRASDAAFLGAGLRRLPPKAVATLQGFPATYRFIGGIAEEYRMIGNAVPPKMAEVVGLAWLNSR